MNDTTPAPDDIRSSKASSSHEHLGYLQGDRTCSTCSYNLVHQPIIREPHYDLLIVRCPECGSVTGLNDYPSLGRWARRWAALFAAVLVLLITAMWVGTGGIIFGFGQVATEIGAETFEDHIDEAFDAFAAQQNAAAAAGTAPATPGATTPDDDDETEENALTEQATGEDTEPAASEESDDAEATESDESTEENDGSSSADDDAATDAPTDTSSPAANAAMLNQTFAQLTQNLRIRGVGADFQQWWDNADQDQLFVDAGGFESALSRGLVGVSLVFAVVFFMVGVIWGIVFIHRKPGFALMWLVMILGIAFVFLTIRYAEWMDRSYFYGSWQAARHRVEPVMSIYGVCVAAPMILLGMYSGPWVARRLATFLLPPRLLSPMDWLWTARGKTPPSRFDVEYSVQPPRQSS